MVGECGERKASVMWYTHTKHSTLCTLHYQRVHWKNESVDRNPTGCGFL